MWAGKKILVTGGAGFIGSHLVEALLEEGAAVTTLDHRPADLSENLTGVRERIEMICADLTTAPPTELLGDGGFDTVFHLAASAQVEASIEDPVRDLSRNAVATVNLLEALRAAAPGTAAIYTSSAVVFAGGDKTPIREDDPTHPTTPYGVSKLASERYMSVYARLYGLRTATVRLFSVYGPRLRKQIVYDFMRRLADDPTRLEIFGDGTETRDMSYVGDAIRGLMLVAGKAPLGGEAYNFASGSHVTTRELGEQVARAFGISPEFSLTGSAHSGDTKYWFADTGRIRALGYAPQTDFADGIARTVDWFKAAHVPETTPPAAERKAK
jgi:UDP-glucose 4-epimerase